jgi:uncharacterized protein
MTKFPRYYPERPLPPYSYVPGLTPHPTSDPRGHSFGHAESVAQPLEEGSYERNAAYLYALDLFNHGFYWEAHEEWETLWHAAGRRGPTADFLKGLIKLAAAGVKAREGRQAGVRRHAERAGELLGSLREVEDRPNDITFGLRLDRLLHDATQMAERAAELASNGGADASRLLPVRLILQ